MIPAPHPRHQGSTACQDQEEKQLLSPRPNRLPNQTLEISYFPSAPFTSIDSIRQVFSCLRNWIVTFSLPVRCPIPLTKLSLTRVHATTARSPEISGGLQG